MPKDIKQQIEAATGLEWARYRTLHPRIARRIERMTDNPLKIAARALQRDAEFAALLARTNDEIERNNIIRVVVQTAWQIAKQLLPVLAG